MKESQETFHKNDIALIKMTKMGLLTMKFFVIISNACDKFLTFGGILWVKIILT